MKTDKRAKLTLKGSGYKLPLGGPATALKSSGVARGLVFPYTPTITYSRGVNYGTYELAHTNYQPKYFSSTQSPTLQVTGLFTNNNKEELAYTVGALHFLRVCSLMHYGEQDEDKGTPPPILLFSAYGKNNFQNFPCVIGNVSYTYDSEIDYVEEGENILPAQMFIAFDLIHQPDLLETRKQFTVEGVANGSLLSRGFI